MPFEKGGSSFGGGGVPLEAGGVPLQGMCLLREGVCLSHGIVGRQTPRPGELNDRHM